MSDEEIIEQVKEDKDEDQPILEVKVVNPPEVKREKPSDYDSVDANEYEDMYPTDDQIKEYESEE